MRFDAFFLGIGVGKGFAILEKRLREVEPGRLFPLTAKVVAACRENRRGICKKEQKDVMQA